jgi:hypothetical protein
MTVYCLTNWTQRKSATYLTVQAAYDAMAETFADGDEYTIWEMPADRNGAGTALIDGRYHPIQSS